MVENPPAQTVYSDAAEPSTEQDKAIIAVNGRGSGHPMEKVQ